MFRDPFVVVSVGALVALGAAYLGVAGGVVAGGVAGAWKRFGISF